MRGFGFLKLRRVVHVFRVLLVHGMRLLWQGVRPGGGDGRGPQRLRQLLEDLGGTYIKFGQVLSLQPDALPVAYCDALFDLLDRVPPFAYSHVETTFREDLGERPDRVFDDFDPVPVASASIGQVHVAYLDGRKYAVKVRRPTVESDFAADILMMRAFAAAIAVLRLNRWMWLVRATREFCSWTHEELDYRYEARFMASLGYNARDNAEEAVPEIRDEFTTPRILVAEFMEGPMVLDYIRSLGRSDEALAQRLRELGFDREAFARNIVRNFVSDAFHHGLFHADLHPANLFILRDNTVGYVDFGITGSLSPHFRRTMVSMTLALTRADSETMMVHFLSIADIEDDSDIEGFRQGLGELMDKWFDRGGAEPEPQLRVTFSIVMLDMLKLSRVNNLWPAPDVIRYLRSVITADGLITRFAPDLDVGRHLEDVCRSYLEAIVRREWLSLENVADLTVDGITLLAEGPAATTRVIDREARDRGGLSRSAEDDAADLRRRALLYGLLCAFSAFLAGSGEMPMQWGFNLFSAQSMVSAIAGILMLRTLLGGIYLK